MQRAEAASPDPVLYKVHLPVKSQAGFTYIWSSTMAKSKKKSEPVFLACEECGTYNYVLRRKPGGEKLNLKKYCPKDHKHTVHKEKKK